MKEVSQRKTNIPYDLSHMWHLRRKTSEHMGRGERKTGERETSHKKLLKDFIYLFEREIERAQVERRGRGRGRSRFPTEQGAQCGTQSHDPGIIT